MKRTDIQQLILCVIGFAGLLLIAAVAPNVIQALDKLHRQFKKPRYFPSQIRPKIALLHAKGLIEFAAVKGKNVVRLTPRGKMELLRYQVQEKTIHRPQWDGQWRMIIFDIHEYKRNIRDRIRRELTSLNFRRLQNSVWVCPYECEEVIALLKADCHIGKELLYVTASAIENDKWLKREFNLL